MSPPPTPSMEDYTPDPRRWRILGVLMVALFMSLIDVSIVNVALPSIQLGLDASQSQLQWVLSGYALAFGVGLVAAGRAGDIYGRGALFITGVAIFTASSTSLWASQPSSWRHAGSPSHCSTSNPQTVRERRRCSAIWTPLVPGYSGSRGCGCDGLGHSALAAGLIGLPSAILSGVAALWCGRNVDRFGRGLVVGGLYIALVGLATLTLADVPLTYAGSSGGIMQTGQRIGTSVGIAVITALAFRVLSSSGWSRAFIAGFAAIMGVVGMTLIVAHYDLRLRRRQAE